MAEQEEGWPLGLQPLNVRVGLVRNRDLYGSASFHTLLSGSPTSSTDSSSDLDTESTGSFFHDRSITLGSLMGVSSVVDLPRRTSMRGRRPQLPPPAKKTCRSKTWCLSLCPRGATDAESVNDVVAPSLGHFLAVERRAATEHRMAHDGPFIYGPDELALAQPDSEPNSLFVEGRVAPPRASPQFGSEFRGTRKA
ncbi:hypothetical protein NMG60_11034012 [Bertholletia excelsa]